MMASLPGLIGPLQVALEVLGVEEVLETSVDLEARPEGVFGKELLRGFEREPGASVQGEE